MCVWGGGGIREVQESVSERIEKVPGRYVDGTLNISLVAKIGKQRAIGNSVVACVCVCVCVRACVCVHACVRACVRACVCLRACDVLCLYMNVWHLLVQTKRGPKFRLLLNLIPGHRFTMFSTSLYTDVRTK